MEIIRKNGKIYTAEKRSTRLACSGCIFAIEAENGNDVPCKEAPPCYDGKIFTKVEEMKK